MSCHDSCGWSMIFMLFLKWKTIWNIQLRLSQKTSISAKWYYVVSCTF